MIPSLMSASVEVDQTTVTLSYTLSETAPGTGPVLFSTTFVGADGTEVRQLGLKLVDGYVSAIFSFDHARAKQQNFPGSHPDRTGFVYTFRLPLDTLQAIEPGAAWRAVLTVGLEDSEPIEGVL